MFVISGSQHHDRIEQKKIRVLLDMCWLRQDFDEEESTGMGLPCCDLQKSFK